MKLIKLIVIFVALSELMIASHEQKASAELNRQVSSKEELKIQKCEHIPTNLDLATLYDSSEQVGESSEKQVDRLRLFNSLYDEYLELFAGKSGEYPYSFTGESESFKQENRNLDSVSNLSCLQWQVIVPSKVISSESVPVKIELRNISNKEISIYTKPLYPAFFLASTRLVRLNSSEEQVRMTTQGIYEFHHGWATSGMRLDRSSIAPNETITLAVRGTLRSRAGLGSEFDLTEAFDLTEPGEYELTFYTRRFINDDGSPAEDQEREFPRKSTARFWVLPKE